MKKRTKNKKVIRYEVRTVGDGDFSYFLQDPECDENGFDPNNKQSAIASAKNFGAGEAWVVKVEETKIII